MKPGRELDALIAEKVMGVDVFWFEISTGEKFPVDNKRREPIACYSTEISAAWEAWERVGADHCMKLTRAKFMGDQWTWQADLNGFVFAHADTAPHAICLAALKAVGVEIT